MPDDYPEKVEELTADDRGRVYLGTDYAEKTVKIAILEVEEDNE